MYNVYEHEMDNLSIWNTISTALFAASSFCLSLAITLWLTEQVSPTSTPAGKLFLAVGAPLSLLVCAATALMGIHFIRKRGGTLRRIKGESKVIEK